MQNNAISFNRCKANTSDYLFYGLQCYKISYMNGNIEGIKKAIIQTSNPNWNRITELSILDCYLENNCPLIDMTDINKFQLTGFVMKRCIINVNSTDYFINSRKFANIFYNSVISENVFYNLLGDNTLFDMGSGTLTMENNTYYYFNNSDPVYITTPFTSITYHASGLQIIQNSAYGSIHSNFLGSKKGLVLTTTEYSTSKPNYTIIYDAPLNIMKLYENGNVHFFQEVKSGPTSERPTEYMAKKGVMYFDTTLGKPIWCKERASGGYNRWVDSDGNNV